MLNESLTSENDSTFSHNLTPYQHQYHHQSFCAATSLALIFLLLSLRQLFLYCLRLVLRWTPIIISQCLTYTSMLPRCIFIRWLRIWYWIMLCCRSILDDRGMEGLHKYNDLSYSVHRKIPVTAIQAPIPCHWGSKFFSYGTVYGDPIAVLVSYLYGHIPYMVWCTALVYHCVTGCDKVS